ncbi:MAG TPA: M56 family metallopeptidase, partial [Terriglobia bacterium]|nr:M56 family metallopeptidase [Terriglobia bacterium]
MTLLLGYAIKSSIVLLVALAGVRVLRGRSAAFRHALLAAGIVAAAAVPLLTVILPTRAILMPEAVPQFLPSPEPIAAEVLPAEQYYEVDALPPVEAGRGSQAEPLVEVPKGTALSVDPSRLLVWLWVAGVGVLVAHLVAGLAQLLVVSRRSQHVTSHAWLRLADEISRQYGLTPRVRLLETSQAVLATWGLLRPTLLLPEGASSWPEDRIRVVLHHELAHVRRKDWLVQMAAEALRAFYWFNPLCWIACEALVQESEQACDDIALNCGITGPDYAQQLLALAVALRQQPSTLSASTSMAKPSTLERRFTALLNPRENRRSVSFAALTLTIVAAVAVAGSIAPLRLVAEPLRMALPLPAAPMVPEALQALTSAITTLIPQTPLQPAQVPTVPGVVSGPGAQGGAASIEGIVVKFGTTEPIPGATVSLQQLPGPGATAMAPPTLIQSGADGKFSFPNLPAGSFRLVALRVEGYVTAEHGQQTFNGRGRPVPLAD